MIHFDVLRTAAIFAEVPDEDLDWLLAESEIREIAPGELLFESGKPVDHLYILLEGDVQVVLDRDGRREALARYAPGEITGLLPYSRMKTSMAEGTAIVPSKAALLHKSKFREMGHDHEALMQTLVSYMADRVKNFTTTVQQNEKMLSLGKLSAGLAHELNNPASAIVRSSRELFKHLGQVSANFRRVTAIHLTDAQINQLEELVFKHIRHCKIAELSLVERSALEDETADWLETRGADDGYEYAETLVEYNLTPERLEKIKELLGADNFLPALEWLHHVLVTERMVTEIQEAGDRISSLIAAVKTYTHMDRATDKAPADLREGLRSTITMLKHKLRDKQIEVAEHYEDDLPDVPLFGGEMNQVWTNLIDNAADAMESGGKLEIEARRAGDFVETRITDNGSGVPPEQLSKIFDPFYTTKAPGQGTGLGLDVAFRIVKKHNGAIKAESEPGRTTFCVCLPLQV